jgi:aspartyl aminopeptidase
MDPGNGFYMIGAHTDSPCLKTKPVTKGNKAGYQMVNIQPYGGGLWCVRLIRGGEAAGWQQEQDMGGCGIPRDPSTHLSGCACAHTADVRRPRRPRHRRHTWFDRDLGVAGRVLIRTTAPDGTDCMAHRLVKIDRPLLRIPMLAIHLQRDVNSEGFKMNAQTNLAPVLATAAKAALGLDPADAPATGEAAKHHAALLDLVAKEAGCSAADIIDFELQLCDVQPGQIGGINNEFVFIGRLDNLGMSFMALQSLIDTTGDGALADETGVRSIALFDHEECGSSSAQGAGGPVMRDTITRVARALSGGEADAVERSMQASFLVSADMAHALHPNYADKHDGDLQPRFHEGLVLKVWREICRGRDGGREGCSA